MATALMSQECGDACDDLGDGNGFKDILIVITFDNNVMKIENIKAEGEGEVKPVGIQLDLQVSPDDLAKKLRTRPIMLNLSRGCEDLGTVKLEISDCFIDAIKCSEFAGEACEDDLIFMKDDEETAVMTFVFKLSRPGDDALSRVMASMKKGFDKQQRKQSERKKKDVKKVPRKEGTDDADTDFNADSSNFDSDSDFSFETDLCPAEEDSTGRRTGFSSKCCSDIATSLGISDCSGKQKTFCGGCGGFSLSGVTCDSKSMSRKTSSQITVESSKICKPTVHRICSECFEDLSVIQPSAPCPKCSMRQENTWKLASLRSREDKLQNSEKIQDCLKSIFEEIFFETKDRLEEDWKRLTKIDQEKPRKSTGRKRGMNSSNSKNLSKKPRCKKVLAVQRIDKSSGLIKKHPGIVLGHKICMTPGPLVPKNMGWLWNSKIAGISKIRRGWRPGAVEKSVAKIMKAHLIQSQDPKPPQSGKNPPTLRVQKKSGEYMIVMNPLRDDGKTVGIETSPIVFKIMKSEEALKRSKAREMLKCRGYEKTCKCTTFEECECFSKCEKDCLRCQVEKVSKELGLNEILEFCDLNESSDSELDVEFTPPSAAKIKHPHLRCRQPKVSYAATQYDASDAFVPKIEVECAKTKDDAAKMCVRAGSRASKGKLSERNRKKTPKDKSSDQKPPSSSQAAQKLPQILKEKMKICCKPCTPDPCCPTYCVPQRQPTPICHRFTTNYNPMYAQCPPRPYRCAKTIPFYY